MQKTIRQLAELVGGDIEGSPDTLITGVCGIKTAAAGDITFASKIRYEGFVAATQASAVVVGKKSRVRCAGVPLLRVEDPVAAIDEIAQLFAPAAPEFRPGIHPAAVVAEGASVDETACVGALCVVEDEAVVGPCTVLYPHVYIGHEAKIGGGCKLHPGAVVLDRCTLGDRVILHPGVVIGADGFGYDHGSGRPEKIAQLGRVEIEDDVEIGANSTVDRARFGRTIIRKNVKLDNLVHIAHNCAVGEGTAISGQVGISGSVDIGRNVLFGGQSGSKDNISIGDGAIITARAGLTKNVPPGAIICGYPDMPQDRFKQVVRVQMKLPQIYERLEKLEEKLAQQDGPSEDN